MIVLDGRGNRASADDVMDYARQCDEEAARLLKRGRGYERAAAKSAQTAREWREIAALMDEAAREGGERGEGCARRRGEGVPADSDLPGGRGRAGSGAGCGGER